MSYSIALLWILFLIMLGYTATRGTTSLRASFVRALEQFFLLVPRMICALIAAGFIAQLIPGEFIAHYLGQGAGIKSILIASAAGILIPAGPAIAFSIAAVFAHSHASTAAIIAFITSWSIFAAHRIFIYEIPMLGLSFLRMRLISAAAMPILVGLIGMAVASVVALPF